MYSSYPLSELVPLKPVVQEDMIYGGILHSLETFGLVSPLIITQDKKIIDGNKRWHVLQKKYGYEWHVETFMCRIPEENIWPAHMVLNAYPIKPADPAKEILRTVSESIKWQILSHLELPVSMQPSSWKE